MNIFNYEKHLVSYRIISSLAALATFYILLHFLKCVLCSSIPVTNLGTSLTKPNKIPELPVKRPADQETHEGAQG